METPILSLCFAVEKMPSTLPANGFDWTWRKSRRKPPNSKKMIITFAKKCEILGLSSEVSPICTDGLVVWCFFNFRETWFSRPPRRNSVRPPLRKKVQLCKKRRKPKTHWICGDIDLLKLTKEQKNMLVDDGWWWLMLLGTALMMTSASCWWIPDCICWFDRTNVEWF